MELEDMVQYTVNMSVSCHKYNLLHQIHLNLNGQCVPVHKSPSDDILNTGVLDEPESPGTHSLLWSMECQDLWLGHDRVTLALVDVPRVDELDFYTSFEWPVQVEVVLTLHHVDVQTEESRSLKERKEIIVMAYFD